MIDPLTAFVFLSTLCQSAEDQIPVTVVQPGDTVTFTCYSEYKLVTWYKQTPGHMMHLIASAYRKDVTENESFKNQRFNFTTENTKYVFTIRNIRKEDEAIYHCMMSAPYGQNFMNGTFLVVNSKADSQSCVHVTQSPSSASVVPGGSVSLQCSLQPKNNKNQIQCPQQQQVHWFRAGSVEPHTGLMSHFTNYSCVYSLSKTIGHSSEAGTYYCAVHTCGHILFGTGTTLDIDVCFGSLSCRKMKFLFIFSFLTEGRRFCANTDWYLELFIIPSTLTKVPVQEKHPQSMMLPTSCFTVGMVLFW
ncbi:uncharacterized protein LOC129456165 [Periophthalmus magnuspinnatus]|uniref:uncharacterized protein LOC129456165 n=1 Tax=Periophthalmus magnuspinnatus TaxID=409849 RepID=UPI0024368FC7|nr:uncharacterized protein LOC129456165 [Periophthalmus magnuspinnatus]